MWYFRIERAIVLYSGVAACHRAAAQRRLAGSLSSFRHGVQGRRDAPFPHYSVSATLGLLQELAFHSSVIGHSPRANARQTASPPSRGEWPGIPLYATRRFSPTHRTPGAGYRLGGSGARARLAKQPGRGQGQRAPQPAPDRLLRLMGGARLALSRAPQWCYCDYDN